VPQYALDVSNLKKFIAALAKTGKVKGPKAGKNGPELGDLSASEGLLLDFNNFRLPPKREFFPQCEAIDTGAPDEAITLFGIRPCDALALDCLDKVFIDEKFVDPQYKKRRDNTLVISMACESPEDSCFCASAGGGPADKTGSDIIAFHLKTSLLFEPVSEKGEALLAANKKLFREPTPKEQQTRSKQEDDCKKAMNKVPVADVPSAIGKKDVPAFWDAIAETCLSCGACTFLCPTCHCFDFHDETGSQGVRKLRTHDACMFASFSREASGHNPRPKPSHRMRQRVMHKFSYTPEIFGRVFCVGCGRCVRFCPSNIDIRETVAKASA
jgi:sulfhydrogenase subunit beta (sulfur reductase)